MSIGVKLQKLRKEKGFTQSDVANITGLDQSSISNIEKGNRKGKLVNIIKICHAIGINPADILTDSDPKLTKYMNMLDKILKEYPDFDLIIEAAERSAKDKNIKILLREFDNFKEKYEEKK